MEVKTFDIEKGLFHFQMQELNTALHAHPVVEIICANQGTFSLKTQNNTHHSIKFAVIDANYEHQVWASNSAVEILMIESNNSKLKTYLNNLGINLREGLFITNKTPLFPNVIKDIKEFALSNNLKIASDTRVQQSIEFIESKGLDFNSLITSLTQLVFLSESRISHLFKQHTGVSIKKYFVWNRLKKAIQFMLVEQVNFTTAAHQSGFYDQAHLSNAFKKFLGVKPSQAYNSRTLQF